ncbi:MAG: FHA domain-containing protein [Planctomycetes bacterium]|nr:FHA domain-containing protein [Planctomycetota bacterium]
MKVVLVRFKGAERRDIRLTQEKCIIGRRPDANLRIQSGDVSRQHCAVTVGPDEASVKDLGSSNGTFVNGKRIAETALRPGDRLALGPVVFVVQIDGKPATIKPEDVQTETAAAALDNDELLDLDDIEFDLDDPISALESLSDEDEDETED